MRGITPYDIAIDRERGIQHIIDELQQYQDDLLDEARKRMEYLPEPHEEPEKEGV